MKSFATTASVLALFASSIASPVDAGSLRYAKRQIGGPGVGPVCQSNQQPSQNQVLTAIQNWNNDVDAVNSFLNAAPNLSPADLQTQAQTALSFASDEPVELGVLACIPALSTDAENAILSLASVFQDDVLDPLMNVVANSGNNAMVTADLSMINNVRCCTVLPALDILWTAAADDEGISNQVNLNVPRPNACATVNC